MNRSSSLALVTLTAVAFTTLMTSAARADAITDLEKSLAEEHATLSTADCSAACRALASIRRAADKICALEPGARCTAAHAKADDATRRVRDACPECAIASITPQPTPHPPPVTPDTPAPPSKKGELPEDRAGVQANVANAPPAESSKGGCASCDAGGASPGDCTAGLLGILTLARVLRRRKRR